jgi:two-component system response regulator
VEDNPTDLELTLHAFARHRLANDVYVVRDGAEALEFVFCVGRYADRRPEDGPDLVILGLKLPKVDGIEVLLQMKADPRTKAIPVTVLVGSKDEKDQVESYRLRVNSYVVKPFDFGQFSEAVATLGLDWLTVNHTPPNGLRRQ